MTGEATLPQQDAPPRRLGHALAIGQVAAFFLCSPALKYLTDASNRYLFFWSAEALALWFAGVTALGLAITAAGWALRRWLPAQAGRIATLAGLGAVVLVGWSVLQAEVPDRSLRFIYVLFALFLLGCLVEISWRRGWSLAAYQRRLTQAALIMAPIVPIYWVNAALFWPRLPAAPASALAAGRAVAERPPTPADNVYIFVFDEWPHRLTMDGAAIRAGLPNLRHLAQQSCIFTDAHAPGCHTAMSMPRIIFQRTDAFAFRGPEPGFWNGEFQPAQTLPSLFTTAQQRGYRTSMFGWYHPYHAILGSSADVVRATGMLDYYGDGIPQRALSYAHMAVIGLLGEPLANQTVCGNTILLGRSIAWQTDELLAYTTALWDDPRPGGQFAIIHLPLPHFPFCYGADGLRALNQFYDPWSEELALGQLAYFDQVLGELLARLRASGRFARSTLVLTSDHNWRHDPAMTARTTSTLSLVPLVIHFPGQQMAVTIDAPFSSNHLGTLLAAARAPGFQPEQLEALLRSGSFCDEVPAAELDSLKSPLRVR